MGGTLEEWLSLNDGAHDDEQVLPYEYLHCVVHVAAGHTGLQAVALLQRMQVIYFMHGTGLSEEHCNMPSVLSKLLSRDEIDLEECPSREDTVLWPLVAAASVNATIHMWDANNLYLASAKLDDLSNLGASYLTAAVQRTVCKAHGLGSATSSLSIIPAGTLMFTLAGVNHLLNFVERALAIPPVWVGDEVAGAIVEVDGGQSLLQRLSTPLTMMASPSATKQEGFTAIGAIMVAGRLDLDNFVPGRDGDVCFQVLLPHAQRPPSTDIKMFLHTICTIHLTTRCVYRGV